MTDDGRRRTDNENLGSPVLCRLSSSVGIQRHGDRPKVGREQMRLASVNRFCAALSAALALGIGVTPGTAQPVLAPLAVVEVAPGVFAHIGDIAVMSRDNEGAIANIGFVVGEDAVAVIDTGGSVREGSGLLAAIRKLTPKPIRYVINTHLHPDHVFGNAAFKSEHPTFVGHKNLPRALAARASFYLDAFRRIMGDDVLAGVKIIPPTALVENELRLDLGRRTLLLRAWPTAHTDNDITVQDETSGTLFTGDLVFVRHVPVDDGSLRGLLAATDALARMSAPRAVPGHGPIIEDWPQALAAQRRYFERLLADIRAMIARGAPIGIAAQTAGQSEKGYWELFEDYNARNATAAFAELEWE
jgi:quinoprotein relay system zinc metallohydrolase 2